MHSRSASLNLTHSVGFQMCLKQFRCAGHLLSVGDAEKNNIALSTIFQREHLIYHIPVVIKDVKKKKSHSNISPHSSSYNSLLQTDSHLGLSSPYLHPSFYVAYYAENFEVKQKY